MEKEDQVQEYVRENGGNAAFHNYINDFSHIKDPLERRRLALEKIDNAGFSWRSIYLILVAGVGFLNDSYDIFTISIALTMMTPIYFSGANTLSYGIETWVKTATSVGAVLGQVGFGIMSDVIGRKKVYGLELLIIIVTTIFQACIGSAPGLNFAYLLAFMRLIQGIGIGGDYPAAAVITAEFSTTKWRGAIMSAVFASQGWGQVLGAVVAIICVRAGKSDINFSSKECGDSCKKALDQMWRVVIGFGAVPGALALYYRLTIPESPRYSLDVQNNINLGTAEVSRYLAGELGEAEQEELDVLKKTGVEVDNIDTTQKKASFREFKNHFSQWKYGKILLGTAASWFILDVAFYGLNLNTTNVLKAIGISKGETLYSSLLSSCKGNLILICAGSVPGYWFSVALIDTWMGRKSIQIMGFVMLTIIFAVIAGIQDTKDPHHGGISKFSFALYIFAEFFSNFGPNTTTFLCSEQFPSRFRGTAHGISAGIGKVGAIFSQTVIGYYVNKGKNGLKKSMGIYSGLMFLGVLSSFLINETKGVTLEEVAYKFHGDTDPNQFIVRDGEQIEGSSETEDDVNKLA
ncbi:related to Inorganic phosphate transporter PHO84 [Hanseniaspora guilliermondii]|uniref:Related to Inorganic phosphate transporter PHO84 n=1 Tax=Hanseniaspora guilliermondii TaxID=56406 RepID=A0A1L0CXQ3_9ASCO|nr:related to Inorganic phosphate transporter PHO84 [Hanseniaspora guilliermondii]